MSIKHCRTEIAGWIILAVLLVIALPLHICMPPWLDITLYDLAARNVLRGGVHYRDIYENNLPGIVWMHVLIRWLFGYGSEVLRAVDVAIVGGIIFLLCRWVGRMGVSRAGQVWTAVLLIVLHSSTSEICHCQRDVWAMLPALAALELRQRQMEAMGDPKSGMGGVLFRSLFEGFLWGAAFWIKPFVAVPALVCWLLSVILIRQTAAPAAKKMLIDAGGMLLGGLAASGLGVAWMILSGCWGPFWNTVLDWNRDYYAIRFPIGERIERLFLRFKGWNLIYVPATALALLMVGLGLLRRGRANLSDRAGAMLAACYLAWIAQATLLQHPHDYVYVPAIWLALAFVVGFVGKLRGRPLRLAAAACIVVFLADALVHHPLLRPQRLAMWPRCWGEGSSPVLRNRLALFSNPHSPNWVQLEEVAEFLRKIDVKDRELACYNNSTHPLYLALNVEPAIPIMHFDGWLIFYQQHHPQLRQLLNESGMRYVVGDLQAVLEDVVPDADSSRQSRALPDNFPPEWRNVFPWYEPVLFRAGRYVVFRVTRPVQALRPQVAVSKPKK
jgi:hypothetical protein